MTVNTWPGWQCVEMLGEGSYGKVFRIRREDFGTTYEAALKVITIPKTKSEIESAYAEGMDEKSVTNYFYSFVEDIVAEFALMSQVKGHTNIVSYEDHMVVQHEDGIGWDILIRMELLTPLLSYAKNNPLQEQDVIRMGIDLCRALKVCRRKGILHRDIKPENIFVNEDGDYKLGDFGVARATEKTVSAMSQKGTFFYMAPEVYKGKEYGYSADLYSLGLVLYRFLNNNRMPFMPPAPQVIRYSDREAALNARMMNRPMSAPLNGSQALKEIVLKACAYDPADRFEEAEDLEYALMQLQSSAPRKEEAEDSSRKIYEAPKKSLDEGRMSPERVSAPLWGTAVEEDDDEDEFEKTVSTFDSYQPRKKEKPQPIKEVDEALWSVEEDDEDEFDKTVSAFDSRFGKKADLAREKQAREEEQRAREEAERLKAEQEKAEAARLKAEQAKAEAERRKAEKAEEERLKAERAQADRERKKAELAKKVEENEAKRKASGKKPMGKGLKIVIALAVSVLVAIPLPPVGIGLAAIWLTLILLKK